MTKYKIPTITLPPGEELLGGLDPDKLHPPFVAAKARVADAESLIERRRRELAAAERAAVDAPARLNRDGGTPDALGDVLRRRDALELLLAQAERALLDARAQLAAAMIAGWQAVQAEIARRAAPIRQAAAELAPALEAIDLLEAGIAGQELRVHQALMAARADELQARNARMRTEYRAAQADSEGAR